MNKNTNKNYKKEIKYYKFNRVILIYLVNKISI